MHDLSGSGDSISSAASISFAIKTQNKTVCLDVWQTVLFLKDDIKGRYYSWRKVLFLFLVSAGSTDERQILSGDVLTPPLWLRPQLRCPLSLSSGQSDGR